MNNKYLLKAMNNEYVIFLHNGYAEFRYGISVNPIMLSFGEYNTLMDFIMKSNFQEIVTKFEDSQNYDFSIPECVAKKIGFSILTLSPPSCFVYTSQNDRIRVNDKKKKLIEIINDFEG